MLLYLTSFLDEETDKRGIVMVTMTSHMNDLRLLQAQYEDLRELEATQMFFRTLRDAPMRIVSYHKCLHPTSDTAALRLYKVMVQHCVANLNQDCRTRIKFHKGKKKRSKEKKKKECCFYIFSLACYLLLSSSLLLFCAVLLTVKLNNRIIIIIFFVSLSFCNY